MEDRYYVKVRFKGNAKAYTFMAQDEELAIGDRVVTDTQYGLEIGEVVALDQKLDEELKADEVKMIVRRASEEDLQKERQNEKDAQNALYICQDEADALDLKMRVIKAEYTLDRQKVTFIYVADGRVDFRELLKHLAAIFHCRIELRQVGARDKARLVGGIGSCGRELCCRRFGHDFDMISINMAKNQLLALNINKLSGHCGKLMCCLKYENEAYKDLRRGLPKLNAQVEYEGDTYRVTSMNVIQKTCKLENKTNSLFISLEELEEKGKYRSSVNKIKAQEVIDETSEEL